MAEEISMACSQRPDSDRIGESFMAIGDYVSCNVQIAEDIQNISSLSTLAQKLINAGEWNAAPLAIMLLTLS